MSDVPRRKKVHSEERQYRKNLVFSPSVARNKSPIANAFLPYLDTRARILEIASGTGEHAVYMCRERSDIIWQPSDMDAAARRNQNAWRHKHGKQILPPLCLDMCQPDWWSGLGMYDALFCSNMIHIAPWGAAQGLACGAGHILPAAGRVGLYGPFLTGKHSAQSNRQFDTFLKAQNPAWGVREYQSIINLFATQAFTLIENKPMPRQNNMLIFEKLSPS